MKSENIWKVLVISVALLMVTSVAAGVNLTDNSLNDAGNEALGSDGTSSAGTSFTPVYKHPKMSPEISESIPPPIGAPLTPITVIIYLTEENPGYIEELKPHVIEILDVEGYVVKAKIYTNKILDINALDFVSYIDVPLRPHQPEISQQAFTPVYKHPKMSPEIIKSIPPPIGGPLTPMTVIIYLTEENPEYIEELKPHVIEILDVEGDVVKAKIYTNKILDINALDFVSYIDVPLRPHQPEFISIGVKCMHADKWHNSSVTGKGVKVAVLECGGFEGYKDLQNQSELPENETVKSFREDGDITAGGNKHGSACAEIIHDVAPDAELFLVNYDDPFFNFSRAVDWLIKQDVDVISHSCCMLVGLFDGNDIWDKKIDEAVEEGIVWVNSAGNYAECHWEGRFNDPDGNDYHNFFEDGDESLSFFLHKGDSIDIPLSWDDSWINASQDYDMELIDSCGRRLKVSDREQSGRRGQIPVEFISFEAPQTDLYHLKIYKYSVTRDVHFETYTPYYSPEYNVRKSSIGGFGTAKGSLTVGAFSCWSWRVEPYSSWGPTNDGREKPELLAPSVVSTKSYYPWSFGGTSASAPHAAGAAALSLSKNSSLTPDEVKEKLTENANHLSPCSPCNVSGYGLINLSFATR